MLFVSAAHSFLRLIITLLLLKNVAIWGRQIERRSLYYGDATAGIQYALEPTIAVPTVPTTTATLTPAVFSHRIYHDYDLHKGLGTGALIPISYGSRGTGTSYYGGSVAVSPSAAPPLPLHVHNHLSHPTTATAVEDDVEPYYYHGDRILKQYLVAEKVRHGDLSIDRHYGNPFQPPTIIRYETRRLPFGGIVDVPVFDTNDLEPRLHPFKPTTLRKNHGPIALGSGSLGFISLPNGNVYLGSGSLGYVSEKQHVDTLTKATPKPFLIPGPLNFGTNEH